MVRLERHRIEFPVDDLLALVVTHVHIDHIGRLPCLLAAGYRGPILCSVPSARLLPLVIEDALRVGFTRDAALIERFLERVGGQLVALEYGVWHVLVDDARHRVRAGRHPLSFENLYTVDSHEEHLQTVDYLARTHRPAVVLAASGMAAGGRIVDYLKAMLEDPRHNVPRHNVLFVGYQAPGTPGHAIQRYGPRGGWVELDGRRYTIRAGVDSISGYSAHADRDDLIRFVRGMQRWPRRIRLIHGDRGAREALREGLLAMVREQGRALEVILPERAD